MNDVLLDAGNIRLYWNRVEVVSGLIFKKTNVYYYSDFYSVKASGKTLTIKKVRHEKRDHAAIQE